MRPIILLLLLTAPWPVLAALEQSELEIFGWVERVQLMDGLMSVKAVLDTGAATSSLHASHIRRFRRGGVRYVGFTVTDPDTAEDLKLEKPLVRTVRIVRHDGNHQRRPVVKMPICLGNRTQQVEVNLIDRSNLTYPMLLGRSALEGLALVDAGQTLQHQPDCSQ